MSVYHEGLWYLFHERRRPTNSAIDWSRFSGSGLWDVISLQTLC